MLHLLHGRCLRRCVDGLSESHRCLILLLPLLYLLDRPQDQADLVMHLDLSVVVVVCLVLLMLREVVDDLTKMLVVYS